MLFSNFKAIILDMDGVFVDTETLVFDIFRKTFEAFSIHLSNEYQYKFIGQPFSKNLLDIRRDFDIDFDDAKMRRAFDDTYEVVLSASNLTVQIGIKEILKQAQERQCKLALCTTSTRHHVDAVFARVRENSFDPNLLFHAVVTGDSVLHKKPHPEPYLTAAGKLGEKPGDCLVFEDSISGIQSAKSAGCYCVALRQPYNRHIDFSLADREIESLNEFGRLFALD